MKKIIFPLMLIILTSCSAHSVKVGKRCTKIDGDNTYEKSYIWLIDKKTLKNFDQKINKENCKINGEKS